MPKKGRPTAVGLTLWIQVPVHHTKSFERQLIMFEALWWIGSEHGSYTLVLGAD